MIVYHGSYVEIFEIDLDQSVINRDFGKGFYVTKSICSFDRRKYGSL